MDTQDLYVGNNVENKWDILTLTYPIERGIITNWDALERYDPKNHPILLTEAPLKSKAKRDMMVQIIFETFNGPAIHFAKLGCFVAYAYCHSTGLCHTLPIYEGYALPYAIMRLHVAGHDLDEYLMKLLNERG
ncbi:beta actin-like protein [Leptotrombidium deliense]|uniref:Beta actin-like protein n=1 Tax=Leptotrombidium deliense TaxID=299467 RepID=A0A443RWW0_9ACAR|nr:beta actin-like protein [Leptotrombidium deliense]